MTTVLNFRRRYRRGGCGAKSSRTTLAGQFLATPRGWLCPRCWQRVEAVQSQAQENEQAPRGATISVGDSPGAAA